ncbi:MAG: Holliday junction resolvase RuvX [Phycisphaerae bacterium]
MTRYVGIDYGDRRIGIAVGDTGVGVATPVTTIRAGGSLVARVSAVTQHAAAFGPDAYVVGLPLHMDGTEGEQARRTRAFGRRLADATGRPVHYWDERLTSVTAEARLEETGLSRRKKRRRVDPVAAQIMLQAFLDDRAGLNDRTGLDDRAGERGDADQVE